MIIREKVRIGDQVVTLETGRIAKQAGGSVLVRAGDTMVLVTVCGSQEPKPGQSFFPLSVDYQEKTYAAGKIPGGFFKREGKLRDYEVLISRLIDRPCRPLFPEGYLNDVQIICTVMSFDQENPPDTLAMIGASAALHISPIPWMGPLAGVRVGRVNGQFIANPTYQQIAESDCELLVAASRDAIVMVEGEADEMSEEDMIEALLFGHRAVQDTLDLIERMQQAVGKPKWSFEPKVLPRILKERVREVAGYDVRDACNIADKHARANRVKEIRKETVETLLPEFPGEEAAIKEAFDELRYNTMRAQVLEEGRRLDGRDTRTVRPISIELGVLPRTHGSALFTRGETQAIVTTTLGTPRDSQRLDTLQGDQQKRFMLHYNFPPYSVGEVKPMRGPGRREIGHGNLAERALEKVLPSPEEFPYTLRVVSEITESNGSSSMASVCGGALALMDAGVPIKAPVAGVAMGLIKEGDDYAVLTDILGDEDALGDMDFKVCGTDKGVTAIQMDIKIEGLSRDILERALQQAREARLHILDKMQRAIAAPREELSKYAPRITQIRVKPDQVRTIIGPGGKMIRAIVDQTGASIDVADDGTVSVASSDSAAVAKALEIIKSLTTEPEIGEVYEGTVKRIEPYGAFIEILPGKDGLCHISDIDFSHVDRVEDHMNLGDKVTVKVTNIDRDGRIRLSRKDALPGAAAEKLNGRAEERRGLERDRGRGRDERARGREERPARLEREERPAARERDYEREERRPRDLEREERRPRDYEREERLSARARDYEREERPAARERDYEREERRSRDYEREDRFVPRSRELEREGRGAKVRELEREDRFAAPREFEREERRSRDYEREDRFVPRSRELEREERPAVRTRDYEREERRPRELEREERLAAKPRELERSERRARDVEREDRFAAKSREFEREDRLAAKPRELEREERAARLRPADDERSAVRSREAARNGRELAEPRRDERKGRELEARVTARPRDLEARARDFDEKPLDLDARASRRELEERRPRGADRDKPARLDESTRRERGARPDERAARTRESERAPRAREEEPVRRERTRELVREERPSARARDVDLDTRAPVTAARDLDREPLSRGRGRDLEREEPVRSRELDERGRKPRAREEEPLPRAREDLRARARDLEPEERAPRSRRELRDEEPLEPRRSRFEDERARGRGAPLERPAARKLERDDDYEEVRTPLARERDERTERERPSRIRARARNRERIREAERERETR